MFAGRKDMMFEDKLNSPFETDYPFLAFLDVREFSLGGELCCWLRRLACGLHSRKLGIVSIGLGCQSWKWNISSIATGCHPDYQCTMWTQVLTARFALFVEQFGGCVLTAFKVSGVASPGAILFSRFLVPLSKMLLWSCQNMTFLLCGVDLGPWFFEARSRLFFNQSKVHSLFQVQNWLILLLWLFTVNGQQAISSAT